MENNPPLTRERSSWVNPWRGELRMLLDSLPAHRRPALRRSLREDALYATDLPLCASPEVCRLFLAQAGAAGWIMVQNDMAGGTGCTAKGDASGEADLFAEQTETGGQGCCSKDAAAQADLISLPIGWLNLRRPDTPPPRGWFPADAEGEAACLRVLLTRHPGRAPAEKEILRLLKAREEGAGAFDRACREIHREMARRLRTGEPLPSLPLT